MFDFFKSLFKPPAPSGETAKERLKLVLLSDHLSLAPDVVDSLKRDLMEVISRYVEIDSANADVTFEHREREIAMLASIPITGVRERKAPEASRLEPAAKPAPSAAVAEEALSKAVVETPEPAAPAVENSVVENSVPPEVAPVVTKQRDPELALDVAATAKPKTPKPKVEGTPAITPVRASNAAAPRRRRRKKYAAAAAAAAGKRAAQQQMGNQASAQA